MITANVIHRVFRVRYGQNIGTAFTIDVDGRQYLVTAKHLVSSVVDTALIDVMAKENWDSMPVRLVGHAPDDVDISVLAADRQLTPSGLPLEATADGPFYGQDVFFLGFPYNILSKLLLGNEAYPLPLAKKAIVSCFDRGLLLLDGHNNPGFSGGPVVFTVPGQRDFKVAAVIAGFHAVENPILVDGQKTPLVYQYNTGIIVAYSIEHATALIHGNPIGVKF